MTAINFPAAPATGATHTEAGITWTFDGTTWDTTGVGYVAKSGDTMTGNLTVPKLISTGDVQAHSLNGGQLAGFRNIIINGGLAINQRLLDVATVPVGSYGQDRWKRTAGGMTQVIEYGDFLPGAVYTLSGVGVTTQQLTAPATGHWTLPDLPVTARWIQLELGTVATPYERRSWALEMMLCLRYCYVFQASLRQQASAAGYMSVSYNFPTSMRLAPTVRRTTNGPQNGVTAITFNDITQHGTRFDMQWAGPGDNYTIANICIAEIEL